MMERSNNYKTLFDPSTGFGEVRLTMVAGFRISIRIIPITSTCTVRPMHGTPSSSTPHDPEGMIKLYPSKEAVEAKLDSLFSEPWRGYEAHNLTGFIGNYCHGNQPGHSIPYTYYFIDKQEKAQCILDSLMNHYYDMGADKLAYAGMDDAGEMSSWYVLNAIGLYTYSPADPEYIVTVPLFDKVTFNLNGRPFTIVKKGSGKKIIDITYDGKKIDGYFITHDQLREGKELVITTE